MVKRVANNLRGQNNAKSTNCRSTREGRCVQTYVTPNRGDICDRVVPDDRVDESIQTAQAGPDYIQDNAEIPRWWKAVPI